MASTVSRIFQKKTQRKTQHKKIQQRKGQ